MFQEIFDLLKFDHLTQEELEKYHHLERTRRSNEDLMKCKLEIAMEIGQKGGIEIGIEISRKIRFEMERKKALNEPINLPEIIGSVVEENFDHRGYLKLSERDKLSMMKILKRHGCTIRNIDNFHLRKKWTPEEIQNLKREVIRGFEHQRILTLRRK
jgi:hypothetical protein